jgi:hypothetical protein
MSKVCRFHRESATARASDILSYELEAFHLVAQAKIDATNAHLQATPARIKAAMQQVHGETGDRVTDLPQVAQAKYDVRVQSKKHPHRKM